MKKGKIYAHKNSCSFIVVLISVLPVIAQISISGKVMDTKGTVIANATVTLKNKGLSTTTGSDGLFFLMQKATSILPNTQSLKPLLSVSIQKGLLRIDISKKSDVSISAISLQGELLQRSYYHLGAGMHHLNFSSNNTGICMYQIQAGKNIATLKVYRIEDDAQGFLISPNGASSSNILKKTALAKAFSDILLVTKTGFKEYSMSIAKEEISGITITMVKESNGSTNDPYEILDRYAPQDEKRNKDYQKYIKNLGELDVAIKGVGKSRTISKTIFVPPNVTYDGNGEVLKADASALHCDLSKGEQAEDQRPFFLLAPGANLRNVVITYPGCEGIHMMGDNALDNIKWEDVGEDAASVRSQFPGGDITITNCEAHHAADKIFQFNAPCKVKIANFTGSDMGKLVRQNGGTDFELYIDLNNVVVTDVISAVVQSDSPTCFVRYHNLEYQFKGSGDKSDRVFRDIPSGNVTKY